MEEVIKYLIKKEQETREKIAEIINNSGLPAFIIEPILKDYYEQVVNSKSQQYQQVMQAEEQKEEEKKKGDK